MALEKDKKRGYRRKASMHKAVRKRKISKEAYGFEWYDNLHQYADNKIHCSCPMCSAKTNPKKKFFGGSNLTMADKKKMASLYSDTEGDVKDARN